MEIDFSKGGGLYIKTLVPNESQATDMLRFVALCSGSDELLKAKPKRTEVIHYIDNYLKHSNFEKNYGVLLESGCFSHSMITDKMKSGYKL